MIQIFAPTPETLGLEAIASYARRVEAMGYDGLFVPDAVHDGLLLACQALAATTHLKVATSVLVAPPRSPMNVALAASRVFARAGSSISLANTTSSPACNLSLIPARSMRRICR